MLDTALRLNIVFGDQFSFNLVIEHQERLQHDEEFLAIWHIAAGKKVKTDNKIRFYLDPDPILCNIPYIKKHTLHKNTLLT